MYWLSQRQIQINCDLNIILNLKPNKKVEVFRSSLR